MAAYEPIFELVTGFDGATTRDEGGPWWDVVPLGRMDRYEAPLSITFAFVATHNHFVLDRGGKVFNRSAPVIKLPEGATEDEHLALLGVLNSSTACFWLKQVCHNKGGDRAISAGPVRPESTGRTSTSSTAPSCRSSRCLSGWTRRVPA